MTNEQITLDFLKSQILGVISTIDSKENKPISAVVAFSETDNLELIFGTSKNTRKFLNIKNNPKIAFAVSSGSVAIQYEGIAAVASGADEENCRNIHLTKNPRSKKYAFEENHGFIKITPKWIRYSDISFDPTKTFEISF